MTRIFRVLGRPQGRDGPASPSGHPPPPPSDGGASASSHLAHPHSPSSRDIILETFTHHSLKLTAIPMIPRPPEQHTEQAHQLAWLAPPPMAVLSGRGPPPDQRSQPWLCWHTERAEILRRVWGSGRRGPAVSHCTNWTRIAAVIPSQGGWFPRAAVVGPWAVWGQPGAIHSILLPLFLYVILPRAYCAHTLNVVFRK